MSVGAFEYQITFFSFQPHWERYLKLIHYRGLRHELKLFLLWRRHFGVSYPFVDNGIFVFNICPYKPKKLKRDFYFCFYFYLYMGLKTKISFIGLNRSKFEILASTVYWKYDICILFQGLHLRKSTLFERAQVKLSVVTSHLMENCLLVVAMIKRWVARGLKYPISLKVHVEEH